MKKDAGMPYQCVLFEKSGGIVANMVANANVITGLLTYQLPTMLLQFMTQFPLFY